MSQTDPNGHVTTHAYDDAARLAATTDPMGGVARRAYDADGRLSTTTSNRPPAGVSSIGNVHSSYFAYQRFTDARVDVENLSGTNLRQ